MNVAKVFFTVNYNNNNTHYYYYHYYYYYLYYYYYYYYYYTRLNVYRQLKRCVDKLTTVENRCSGLFRFSCRAHLRDSLLLTACIIMSVNCCCCYCYDDYYSFNGHFPG